MEDKCFILIIFITDAFWTQEMVLYVQMLVFETNLFFITKRYLLTYLPTYLLIYNKTFKQNVRRAM